jgi:hypothetical protein
MVMCSVLLEVWSEYLKIILTAEANPYYHNVFAFMLFLPEGRVDVAWEPSNKMMLFLRLRK